VKEKALSKLRSRVRREYREYEAIKVFLNHMTVDARKRIEATKKNLASLKESELRIFLIDIKEAVEKDRELYGIKVPLSRLVELLNEIESNPPDRPFVLIPKYLLRELFDHYEKANPNFDKYPEHFRIVIDPGIARQQLGTVEVGALEATLFEDMCALFNLAKQANTDMDRWSTPKKITKTADALLRATIAAAFCFIESYLNGIAFDYYIRNKDRLDPKTIEILTESKRYISLSEKVNKYPRIILDHTQAPLNKDNCPELSFIMSRAKLLRDAIAHASPMVDIESYNASKEQLLTDISLADVESVVDNAIRLVKRINLEISGTDNYNSWFTERDQSGYFSEAAFS